MKLRNPIADGDYMLERIEILKDLCIWKKMSDEERQFFTSCGKCEKYKEYAQNNGASVCPCAECKSHKAEIDVDNRMITLRRKYF